MDIVVIGAGASGLFYSLNASAKGHNVVLLDGNEKAGKKLFITGKGRCNVTNDCDNKTFMDNVVTNSKFLFSAVNKWNTQDTINFFNHHGCEVVTERGNRVFPKSGKSYDIISTLQRECVKEGTTIIYKTKVTQVYKDNDVFVVKTQNGRIFKGDALVIATGGKSYSQTGSTGDGYRFAQSFGHHIIEPVGALVPIRVKEKIPHGLIKMTLKNVSLTCKEGKWSHTEFGDLEFLPNALTGPISLTMSSLINRRKDVSIELDLKPALSKEQLDARLLREIKDEKNKVVLDLLKKLLPSDLIPLFSEKCKVDTRKELNFLTKEERETLVNKLKCLEFTFDGLDNIDHAIVTSGGIDTKEIRPSSMESKLVDNLYFIGEVVDLDAFTGGFNIQIALSTAYLAADSLY